MYRIEELLIDLHGEPSVSKCPNDTTRHRQILCGFEASTKTAGRQGADAGVTPSRLN